MQVCTYLEHMSHQTAALCEAMDSQRDMLAAIIDGIDGYVDTLKRTLATVRELSDNMRSNYRYKVQPLLISISCRHPSSMLYRLVFCRDLKSSLFKRSFSTV